MGTERLAGKRILVTSALDYMGPAIVELFRDEGADVVADVEVGVTLFTIIAITVTIDVVAKDKVIAISLASFV